MTALLGCAGILAIIPALAIVRGWVLSILWGWFMVPLFHLPALSIPYAIGISIVVGMFHGGSLSDKKREDKTTGELVGSLLTSVAAPFFSLFLGWIVRHWL